ncbi:hypothetical protein T12_1392, partial [Trichinella patagoniensis]
LAARSSMLYHQSPMSALQQQQQLALHSQLSMSSGTNAGFNVFHGDGTLGSGVFADFGRGGGGLKQGMGGEGRSGNGGGGQNG